MQSHIVNGKSYLIGKLSAMNQFHVTRRLLPILSSLNISQKMLSSAMSDSNLRIADLIGPAMDAIAGMANDDVEAIIRTCLTKVYRDEPGARPAPIMNDRGDMMYADIEMPQMIELTIESIKENVGNFFASPPSEAGP